MSHDRQIYRNGRAQGSDCDRRPGWQREAGHGKQLTYVLSVCLRVFSVL